MKTIAPLAPLLLPLFSSLAAFITTAEARVEVEDIENVELLEMADYIKNVSGMELDPTSLIAMLVGVGVHPEVTALWRWTINTIC